MEVILALMWIAGVLTLGWVISLFVYNDKPRKKRKGFWSGYFEDKPQ